MNQVSGCDTTSQKCKQLWVAAENARRDWLTKHQASCTAGQPHSNPCNQAYQYYSQQLKTWSTACCSKYDSPKIQDEHTIEMLRAFEETKAIYGNNSGQP